jgi:ATP-binding protein involved in chromosome partitioning
VTGRYDPVEVAPTEDAARLRIRWADGHVSEYEPRYLRLACRCAGCVDEYTNRPLLRAETVPLDVYPLDIRYVGRYAIRFDWSDFHSTGIYTFEALRDLCPCPECRALRGEEDDAATGVDEDAG